MNKQVAFKGEFEDVMALAKVNNSPNTVDIEGCKFLGPRRTIQPTIERFNLIKQAVEQRQIKGAWYGLFEGVIDAWTPFLKK